MGIEVEVIESEHRFYTIERRDSHLVPGIRFLCEHHGGEPSSSNHDETRWVSLDELKALPEESFIPGLWREFIDLLERPARRRRTTPPETR